VPACGLQTLSFLTYVLRGFPDKMSKSQDTLAKVGAQRIARYRIARVLLTVRATQTVLQLLQTCPHDATNSRKELLVAMRHILATAEFRKVHCPCPCRRAHVSQAYGAGLLQEDRPSAGRKRVDRLGPRCDGDAAVSYPCVFTAHVALTRAPRRPLAYNTLADLIHHARQELSLEQFRKIVYLFARNVHDPTLPLRHARLLRRGGRAAFDASAAFKRRLFV
jgi:transformation/transcription domain-associated protein